MTDDQTRSTDTRSGELRLDQSLTSVLTPPSSSFNKRGIVCANNGRARKCGGPVPSRSLPRTAPGALPNAELLSTRQIEILKRLVGGERVPGIARSLYLSQSTSETISAPSTNASACTHRKSCSAS